jgi:MFS family permease
MTQPEPSPDPSSGQLTVLPSYRPTVFGSLKHRNFRLFIIGQFVSLCGTWIQNVAQGWLVYQLSSSAFKVGLVSSLGSLPVLGFTLYGGALADRVNKHRWILLLQSLMLIPVLGLAVMVQLNRVTVTWVAVAALVLGVLNAFEVPARQAFVVDMAGREDLMNAIALNSSIFNLSRIIGPTIAGILITTAGIALCFYANAVSFLAVVIGLLLMRMPPEQRRAPTERTGRLWDGLQYVTSEPWPKALVIITGTLSVFRLRLSRDAAGIRH